MVKAKLGQKLSEKSLEKIIESPSFLKSEGNKYRKMKVKILGLNGLREITPTLMKTVVREGGVGFRTSD